MNDCPCCEDRTMILPCRASTISLEPDPAIRLQQLEPIRQHLLGQIGSG